MPRRPSTVMRKDWKISLPATLAGAVEFALLDPVTKKPQYAERSKLIARLLNDWLQANHSAGVELPKEYNDA